MALKRSVFRLQDGLFRGWTEIVLILKFHHQIHYKSILFYLIDPSISLQSLQSLQLFVLFKHGTTNVTTIRWLDCSFNKSGGMGVRSKYVYPPGSTDQLDTGWGPQDSQVGLQVAEFYGLWQIYNYIQITMVNGVYKPTYNWAPSCSTLIFCYRWSNVQLKMFDFSYLSFTIQYLDIAKGINTD